MISGATVAVDEVCAALRARGARVERLAVSHAFHSPLMDPVLESLEQLASPVRFAEPRIDLVSNLTGQRFAPGQTLDACYLRRHARETVRFRDGMASLHELGYSLFVEIGPRPVLLEMGRCCLPEDAGLWLPSVRRRRDDWQSMLDSLGALYVHGATVDWAGFDRDFARHRVALPTYPFQRQRYWAVQAATDSSRAVEEAVDPRTIEGWLHRTEWRPRPTAALRRPSRDLAGHWIILADSGGIGRRLAGLLEAHGATFELVTAAAWQQGQDATLSSPPPCRGVIHLWGLDAAPSAADTTPTSLQQDQARHCASVLRVVKALVTARQPDPPRLWIVTRGAQPVRPAGEDVAVAQAPLWGLGKTIALEHPQIWGGLIDLDPQAATDEQADDTAMRLLQDICAGAATPTPPAGRVGEPSGGGRPPREDQVAWRGGQRHVARLSRADKPLARPLPLRADATYAITGGLGGLGSAIAAWMAQRGARHLALLGRSAAPDSPTVQALTRTGTQVLALQADVTRPDQLSRALHQIEATMPPLRGIIHAAGVLDDGLLAHQDWTRFQRVLAPKVEGAWNLHALTRTLPLDFFVLFSSTASLLGSPGQANYAAANAFLDALAHHRRAQGLPALAINWGPWELGMAASAGAASRRRWASMGIDLLTPAQGVQALASLVGGPASQVAVVRVDWARLAAAVVDDTSGGPRALLAEQVEATRQQMPPAEQQPARGPRRLDQLVALRPEQRADFLRDTLRRYAGKVLGMAPEELPLTGNLQELGMDSLMVVEVTRAIKRDFQLALYPRELYEHPTIDALAAYLDTEMAKAHTAHHAGRAATSAVPRTAPSVSEVSAARPPAAASGRVAPAPARPDIVFLLSGPRSGSTLLRVMLAGHPRLFCPPELHLLAFATLAQQRQELDHSYLHEGLQRALMELHGCDAATSKALVDSWIAEGLATKEVYARLRRLATPRLLVDKSPTYAGSMDTLRRAEALFGEPRYLCLVRHPYATIESFARTRMHKLIGADEEDPFVVAEQVWVQTNQNMLDFLRQVDPGRRHVVRFEDLVRQPEETTAEICAFLGIPADPAVLRPYDGERMTDGVHGPSLAIGDPNFLNHDRIEPDLADAWKTITLPRPLGSAARQLAAAFRYTLSEPDGSTPGGQPVNGDAVPTGQPANGHRPPARAAHHAAAPAREYAVTANGVRLCVTARGPDDGPAIVCLHGILDHAMVWEDVAAPLATRGYQLIAPDQRGHGCSGHAAAGTYQLLNYVADLDALLCGLAGQIAAVAQPVVLAGHSMGAAVAATYASLRPNRVGALVLIEALMPGEPSDDEFARLLDSRLQYLASTPMHAVLPDVAAAARRLRQATPSLSPERAYRMAQRITQPHGDGVCWRWDPALLTRADLTYDTLSITPARYRSLLARITAPVTLVYGQADSPHLAQLRAVLPRATAELLPGGHNLHLEAPIALAEMIVRSAARAGIAPSG